MADDALITKQIVQLDAAAEVLPEDVFPIQKAAGPAQQVSIGQLADALSSLGVGAAGLVYQTRADLFLDLQHPARTAADVVADATAAFNGRYMKSGAVNAGAWAKVSDLGYAIEAAEVDRIGGLRNSGWLHGGVFDGTLGVGAGWTAAKIALAKAIKAVRVDGFQFDPAEIYYLGIFQNNAAGVADNINVGRNSTGASIAGAAIVVDKSATGITQVVIGTLNTLRVTFWIDYRELAAFPGTLTNSFSKGPLWLARATEASVVGDRLAAIEAQVVTRRNQAMNPALDPNEREPIFGGLIPGQTLPYKAPQAELAARGVKRSISVGPLVPARLAFFYWRHEAAGQGGRQFIAGMYIRCDTPADFPAQLQCFAYAADQGLGNIIDRGGFVQLTANLRRYWVAGDLPANPNLTHILVGPGALMANPAEVSGGTWRVDDTAMSDVDMRQDDWLGEFLDAEAVKATAQSLPALKAEQAAMTPHVSAVTGALQLVDDARAVLVAAAIGGIGGAGVQQLGDVISWVDDPVTTHVAVGPTPAVVRPLRRSFNRDGLAALPAGVTKIVAELETGQSNSVGTASYPIITQTPPWVGRAFTFNGGSRPCQGISFTNLNVQVILDRQMQRLIPLIEQLPPENPIDYGETHGGGMAWWLGAPGRMAAGEVLVFGTVGFGGLHIAQLQEGSIPFENGIRAVERLNAWCELAGIELEVGRIHYDQGQADYETNPATWTASLLALQASLTTRINAITGSAGQIPLVIRQPTSWTRYGLSSSPAMCASVDVALANPTKFILAGPQYADTGYVADGVHRSAAGNRLEGEYRGRATQLHRAAAPVGGLVMTGIVNVGTQITATTNALTQLAIDTALVSAAPQNGLRLIGPDGVTEIPLNGIAILGANEIRATAAAPLSPGLTYTLASADKGTIGQSAGAATGPRSNFRDSSADLSSTGARLYNWLHVQRRSWVAG